MHHIEPAVLDEIREALFLRAQRNADFVGSAAEANLPGTPQLHDLWLFSLRPNRLSHQGGQNGDLMTQRLESGPQIADMRLNPAGALHVVGADLCNLHGDGGEMS